MDIKDFGVVECKVYFFSINSDIVELLLFVLMLWLIDKLNMLKLFDLDFLCHLIGIEFNIKFFANNFNQMHFGLNTKDRQIAFRTISYLLKDIHEQFILIELKELILLVGFMFLAG